MKQKGLACLEFTVSKWNVRENFNNAEDEEKQTIGIKEKLDGKNGGYIWGELLVATSVASGFCMVISSVLLKL